jgi:phage terminase large subunit-like protein
MSAVAAEDILTGHQRPRLSSVPAAATSALAEDAIEFAGNCGMALDDWQQWSLQQCMGCDHLGLWSAFEVCIICSRQNGKNKIIEARQLFGLFVLSESLQIHTAHEFKASGEHFLRMQATVRSRPDLMRRVKPNGIRTSHGEEAIELRPRPALIFGAAARQVRRTVAPRLRFLARSRGSGRSFTADTVYYDEAMFLSDEEVGASMPTMSAVANPQMWYTASAGGPDSIQLGRVRKRGNAGTDDSLAYLEWSCEYCGDLCPDKDRHDCRHGHDRRHSPRSWARANPGMNIRISQRHISREFEKMPDGKFDRERLGIGDWPVDDASWSVVPEHQWEETAWPEDQGGMPRPQRIAVSVDITPDQSASCIAIAGLLAAGEVPEGETPPERKAIIEIGSDGTYDDHRAGVDWVVPRLRELKSRNRLAAIVIDPIGPGAELIVACESAGLEVEKLTLRDVAAAHAQYVRAFRDGTLWHRDQEALRTATASAVTRDVGDGQRAWSRKSTDADISPVCAATTALWAARKFGRGYDPLSSVR